MLSTFFRVSLFAVGALAAGYNWDRCDTVFGPLYWGTLTGGQTCGTVSNPQREGSPINLCGAVAFNGSAPTFTVSGYDTLRNVNAGNDGSNLVVSIPDNQPTLTLGTISTIVGRTTNTSVQTWVLAGIHGHWGRVGRTNEGSEHYMQGVAYPFEIHFVHYNKRFSSLSAAVSSGASDALLVVGTFFTIGNTDATLVAALGNAASSLTQTMRPLSTQVVLSDIFNGVGSYYSYRGSLTTPGCAEIVTWVVMKTPVSITAATLDKLKTASMNPAVSRDLVLRAATMYSTYGTYRPLQPLNGRTIYSSDGVTAACASFTEVQKTCESSGLSFGPSVALHIIGLAIMMFHKL